MTGGHDHDNIKDFPGGFSGDAANKFTKTVKTADVQEMFELTREWINYPVKKRCKQNFHNIMF